MKSWFLTGAYLAKGSAANSRPILSTDHLIASSSKKAFRTKYCRLSILTDACRRAPPLLRRELTEYPW